MVDEPDHIELQGYLMNPIRMPEDMLQRLSDLASVIGQTGKVPEPPRPASVIVAGGSAEPEASEAGLPTPTHSAPLRRQ